MLRISELGWLSGCKSWSWALLFLDKGSGEEETDEAATAHESFELSELNDTSITPFGLLGKEPNLRLLDGSPLPLDANSKMSLQHSSTLSCYK